MRLPFLNIAKKSKDELLAIDLGGRTTKAVHIRRTNGSFALSRYALLDAPIYEKSISPDLLAEHLKNVAKALEAQTRQVTLAIGVNEGVVRQAEMPLMPVDDLRQILKNNTKTYLQQDLPGHVFDCHIFPPKQISTAGSEKSKGGTTLIPKTRILAAGARKQLLEDLETGIKNAGMIPDHVVPGIIGPVNAFEMAMPEVFAKSIVALVDIGFKYSSICILQEGELMLNRVVAIGGDRLTSGLAESMGISYAEAEGIKIGMPTEVQPHLEPLVAPLGRELRASIDFFEHQHDKAVTQIFVSGGSARSEFIMRLLQTELLVDCKNWNPVSFLQLALTPQQTVEIEHVAPQLTVAVGAAMAAF